MGDRDRAQAEVLIWALCDLRDKMLSQMARLEKHGSRREAAALRRDVNEAQALHLPAATSLLGWRAGSTKPAGQRIALVEQFVDA